MPFRLFLSAVFLTFNISLFAQVLQKENLDNYLERLASEERFMGSVALLEKNKIIYTKAVGYSNTFLKKQVSTKSTYQIGSISKTFTATMILQAVEAGKLRLDTPLKDFYPTIANADKITVKNLLNHTSGISNFTDSEKYLSLYTRPQRKEDLVAFIAALPSRFEVGQKHEYSNSNYLLLSYILEDVYKKEYAKILAEKIVKPLKLKSTYLGAVEDKEKVNSYRYMRGWHLAPKTHYTVPMGAGAVVSTPSDLVKFGAALLQGNLLKRESLDLMLDFEEAYGLGIFQLSPTTVGHTGGIDGFQSILIIFEKGDKALAIISNGMNYNLQEIVRNLETAWRGERIVIPDFKAIQLSSEMLQLYTGVYKSDALPLEINISQVQGNLQGQATGQGAFPLEAVSQTVFIFQPAGIQLTFNLEEKRMLLEQGGQSFIFYKS